MRKKKKQSQRSCRRREAPPQLSEEILFVELKYKNIVLSRQLREVGKMSLTDTYTSIVRKALKTSAKENQPKTLTPR